MSSVECQVWFAQCCVPASLKHKALHFFHAGARWNQPDYKIIMRHDPPPSSALRSLRYINHALLLRTTPTTATLSQQHDPPHCSALRSVRHALIASTDYVTNHKVITETWLSVNCAQSMLSLDSHEKNDQPPRINSPCTGED